jgi:hypothetical protein
VSESRLSSFWKSRLTYFGALLLLVIAYAIQHFRAAYTLPVPWPDEAFFIWPANAFAEHWTLFSPEIDVGRTLFWMPPGYLVVLGFVIKFFGLSLAIARGFSFTLALASIVLLALIVRRYAGSLLSLILMAPFVLGPPAIAFGNVARMESLLILLALIAFYLLQQSRPVGAVGVLLLTPLVHPNGVYFLAAGLIAAWMLHSRRHHGRPSRLELAILAFAVLCWIGYAAYAALHWNDFIRDMVYQFHRKAARNLLKPLLSPASVLLLLGAIPAAIYCYRKKLGPGLLFALAVPVWWAALTGSEMWYGIFFSLGFYLFLLVFMTVAADVSHRVANPRKGTIFGGAILVAAFGVIGWNAIHAPTGETIILGDSRPWYSMKISSMSYMTADDQATVAAKLRQIPQTGSPIILRIRPYADALFFLPLRNEGYAFSTPMFSSDPPDWYLVHMSRLLPPIIRQLADDELRAAGVTSENLSQFIIRSRDTTEYWVLAQAPSR